MIQKTVLNITGMHCNSCAKIIEATLEEKEGISLISVDYDSRKAFLEFDADKTNLGDIKTEIESLGYKAT